VKYLDKDLEKQATLDPTDIFGERMDNPDLEGKDFEAVLRC